MQSSPYSLSQLQQAIGNTLRLNPDLREVWVQAEFSDLRLSGGHCYVELLEKDTYGTNRAKMRANIWSSTFAMLRRKFYETTGRDMASGMKVLVRGSVNHHNIYGLSFTISDIDPSYTLGDMERLKREILQRLTDEGIIDRNKQVPISPTPQRLAVISAEGAAGYGDFIDQLKQYGEGFAVYPFLFPAVMQGERCAPSVMAALHQVYATRHLWDAVIIIRGGGATTDLNGFDNYELARCVATFPLPVIVGIGHERDRTVLDEIACVRCKTPTAVAAYVIDSLRDAYTEASDLVRRIAAYGADALRGEHLRLANISQSVPALARNTVLKHRMQLNTMAHTIPTLAGRHVMQRRMALDRYSDSLRSLARERIATASGRLQPIALKLSGAASALLQREKLHLQRLDDMQRILSPLNTLRRGYSITRVNGHAIKDSASLKTGDIVETTLHDGKFTATVTEK